ncbi:hypothetical protein Tco_0506175 [Tanacetum coccineum]
MLSALRRSGNENKHAWSVLIEPEVVTTESRRMQSHIRFPNSKATSGSGMILSSANIETFFLTTLLLAVHFLAGSESDSSDTSTVSLVVSAVFFPCEPLPLLFLRGN